MLGIGAQRVARGTLTRVENRELRSDYKRSVLIKIPGHQRVFREIKRNRGMDPLIRAAPAAVAREIWLSLKRGWAKGWSVRRRRWCPRPTQKIRYLASSAIKRAHVREHGELRACFRGDARVICNLTLRSIERVRFGPSRSGRTDVASIARNEKLGGEGIAINRGTENRAASKISQSSTWFCSGAQTASTPLRFDEKDGARVPFPPLTENR